MQTLANPARLTAAVWCFVNTIVFPGDLFKPVYPKSEKIVNQIMLSSFFVQYAPGPVYTKHFISQIAVKV